MIADWQQGLAGFSAEEIRRGLAYCRDNLKWPPSIAEFRMACRPDPEHNTAAYREYRPDRLLGSEARTEQRKKNYAKFKQDMEKLGLK